MSNAPAGCASALAILREIDSSLVSTMEASLGRRPSLQLLSSSRPSTPDWAVPPLSRGAEVLLRSTAYTIGSVLLSRHFSAVSVSVLGLAWAGALEEDRISLADVLQDASIHKVGVRIGMLDQGDFVGEELRRSFAASHESGSWACRRYEFLVSGVPAGVVIECLPCDVWERLVGVQKETARTWP